MQIRQLITVLGLCLSQTRAVVVAPLHDDPIKSIVMVLTQSDKSPGFSLVNTLHQNAHIHHELGHALISVVTPILKGNEKEIAFLGESFVGARDTLAQTRLQAHPEVRAQRLQAYRNSLYSQITDLVENNPQKITFKELKQAHEAIISAWSRSSVASDQSTSPEAFLEKVQRELAASITRHSEVKLEKLSREEINRQLESTKLEGVPDPMLISGRSINMILGELHHLQNHSQFRVPATVAMPVAAAA